MVEENNTAPHRAQSRRAPLDRHRITRSALALIDQHGIEQLTMRGLGQALEVEAMALYYHYASKAELLDAILDKLLDDVEQTIPTTVAPLERIRATFCAARALASNHPNIFLTMVTRRFRTLRALQFYERLLADFHAAGLDAGQSAAGYRLLANFTVGAGMAEVGLRESQGNDSRAPVQDEFSAGADFPMIAAILPYQRLERRDAAFQTGLDLLLAQLRRQCAARSAVA